MSTDTPEDWPDIEGALRTWLRQDPGLAALIGNRVFFGIPRNSEGAYPCIMITRIGGGQQSSEVPLDNALIQFDVYGEKADKLGGGRKSTTMVALALRKALSRIRGETRLDEEVVAYDPRITSQIFSPLPGDDRPRIMIVAIIPSVVQQAV